MDGDAAVTVPDAADFGREVAPEAATGRCVRKLHAALSALDRNAQLDERLRMMERLAHWVCRGPKPSSGEESILAGGAPSARLRMLVRALDAAPKFRDELGALVRSVLNDTDALALFCEMGLHNMSGVWRETADRLARDFLPAVPEPTELSELLARMFRSKRDARWLEQVDPEIVRELVDRLDDPFGRLRETVDDATRVLATRVSALGLTLDIRDRSPEGPVRESPFFALPTALLEELPALTDRCRADVAVVHQRMEKRGVSVDVVFRLDLVEQALDRIDSFVAILRGADASARCTAGVRLLAHLTRKRLADRSLVALVRDNSRLLAQKIIERAGETGEHYITTTRSEWWRMIASAGGGGILTTATCVVKFLTKWGHWPLFVDGVLSSANYAASFVLMQFLGLTLATKQPSMTAAALAHAIHGRAGDHDLDEVAAMVARTTRSQLAAAIGNVGMVVPTCVLFHYLYRQQTGETFLDAQSARDTVASFHPLQSGTIPFAALTGVLLWCSSLGAGWLENWAVYRNLPKAIASHRWGRFLGRGTFRFLSRVLVKHVAGFGGNLTLGLLLGMVPVFAKFVGLPLDVRHVTLSAGALTLSLCSLGPEVLGTGAILTAAGGVAIIGFLNFTVSFTLALFVAFRAKEVSLREAFRLLWVVIKRFFRRPFEFVYPPRSEETAARPAHAP